MVKPRGLFSRFRMRSNLHQDIAACINKKLHSFLCKYRIIPQRTTNESLSMLLYGRNIRAHFDIMKPDLETPQTLAITNVTDTSEQTDESIHELNRCLTKCTSRRTLRRHGDQTVGLSKDQAANTTPVDITADITFASVIPCPPDKSKECMKDSGSSTLTPRRNPPRIRSKPDKLNL